MTDYKAVYKEWLKNAKDKDVLKSLAEMQGDEEKIQDAFYKDLEFGTGGLRGIMEAGTNRLNVYTIFRTSLGVAEYMKKNGFSSCAIAHDSRNNSKRFSEVAAATLASCGMKVYLAKDCMPTPFLSFMVRYHKADMGINITASHNAAQYNGFKVYNSDGCQLTDENAMKLTALIEKHNPFSKEIPSFSDYENNLIVYSDDSVEETYKKTVLAESLYGAAGVKVVYTPLNGAGYRIVPDVLKRAGVTELTVVPEQSMPDGNFPTCPYPNPEMRDALSLAIKLAESNNADAVIANDPDSDRLGVAARNGDKMQVLSGNDVGLLFCDFILMVRKNNNSLPLHPVIVKTIVSTPMVDALAKKHGVEVTDVLTGFKYIGNAIKKLENKGCEKDFVFGFEESCGYLKGSYVRDKDGVVAAMLFAECVAYHKQQGKTVFQRLSELRNELGNYVSRTLRYTFGGMEGIARKQQVFDQLRNKPLTQLAGKKIVESRDYLTQTKWDLPKSNVLWYKSEDDSRLILRPSGTEPLVKCYLFAAGNEQTAEKKIDEIKAMLDKLLG